PVFVGHSEAVNIEFDRPISDEEARDILREAPGCLVVDKREDGGYVTPIECVGDYATYISRIRVDPTIENGLNIWVVSDNLRKGAAQIVGHDPDIEAVLDSGIDPDAADIGRVVTHTFNRRDIAAILALVHDKAARRLAENIARFLVRDWPVELDIHRFRMTDENR